MIELEIPFPPVPWAAAKVSRRGTYDPKEKDKRAVRFYIREQYEGEPLDGFFVLQFKFTFSIPVSYSKKDRISIISGQLYPTRCDTTNLQKLYEDCLKGIVIKDDRKVVKIISEKIYGAKDNTKIKIYTIDEYCLRRSGQQFLLGLDPLAE